MSESPFVLVVEEDLVAREMLEKHLRAARFDVVGASTCEEASRLCGTRRPDVVVLYRSPSPHGELEVCRQLRESHRPSGVILVEPHASEAEVVQGLEDGADDVVVNPFGPKEMVARVRALARRLTRTVAEASGPRTMIQAGELSIDVSARRVFVGQREVSLTPKELDVLVLLAGSPERVFTRTELLFSVWSTDHEGYARNVDVHVMRLRKKLQCAGFDASKIETRHGAGYLFRR